MQMNKPLLLAVLALSVTACQAQPQLARTNPAEPVVEAVAGYGSTEVRVRWPRQTQALPSTANTMVVNAYGTMGTLVASATLRRATAVNGLSSTEMRLPASTYTIEAFALKEQGFDPSFVPVAQGSSAGNVIRTNQRTNLTMTLTAYQPTGGALSGSYGGIGSRFTIDTVRAFNHPASQSTSVKAWFSTGTNRWVEASASFLARRATDPVTGRVELVDPELDKLLVEVPAGITGACTVYVESDGVKSASLGTFNLVDRLEFEGASVTRRAGESFSATANTNLRGYSLAAAITVPGNLSYPMLTWSSSAPDVAFVTQNGTVYANKPGRAVITATTGAVKQSFEFLVTDSHSTASVTVAAPSLGSGNVGTPIEIPAYTGVTNGTVQ